MIFIGIITSLQQIYLAIYDTSAQQFVYTGSEHIDITDNHISLNLLITIHSDIVFNPRAYDNPVFEMISGTCNFAFRQNTIHGGQPIIQIYASTEACKFHGNCEIPNMYNQTPVYIIIADICNDIHIKTEIDTLISNRCKQLLY